MSHSTPSRIVLLTTLCLSLICSASWAADLPDYELVLRLRQARIDELADNVDAARAMLLDTSRSNPDSLVVAAALFSFSSRHPLSEEENRALLDTVIRAINDLERQIPIGTLRYVILNAGIDPPAVRAMLPALLLRGQQDGVQKSFLDIVATAQLRVEDLEGAAETLRRRLKLEGNSRARTELIVVERTLENWASVERLLSENIAAGDNSPYLQMARAESLAKNGDYEALSEVVDALIEQGEEASVAVREGLHSLLVELAWEARDAAKDDIAEQLFRRALKLAPHDTDTQSVVLYLYSNDDERAQHHAALRDTFQEEDDAAVLYRKGSELLAANQHELAADLLERSARAEPDFEPTWYNLGLAAYNLERWELAEEAYAAASQLNPSRLESRLYLGIAIARQDKWEQSIPLLEQILVEDPTENAAHYWLYVCHTKLGHVAESSHYLKLYEKNR